LLNFEDDKFYGCSINQYIQVQTSKKFNCWTLKVMPLISYSKLTFEFLDRILRIKCITVGYNRICNSAWQD
jgi:hypothetical protein